jgi:hypothetical protein
LRRFERLAFAVYTCFVAYWITTGLVGYPWSWLLVQSVVLFFIRIHTRAEMPVNNRRDPPNGDVYIVSQVPSSNPKRGYPSGSWLVKRNSTIGAGPSGH